MVSILLGICLFTGVCNSSLASGINKVEILSDGTRLTYVSSDRLDEARQLLVKKIQENRKREYNLKEDLMVKVASVIGGILLYYAETNIKNKYLKKFCMMASTLASFVAFMYPQYVNYDVNRVENHKPYVMTGLREID